VDGEMPALVPEQFAWTPPPDLPAPRWHIDRLDRPDPLAAPEGYGAGRVSEHREGKTETDGRCDVHHDGVRCPRPRNWVVAFGCIHEHVGQIDACDPCITEVATKRFTCEMCGNQTVSVAMRFERLDPPGRWDRALPAEELPGARQPR
jgi:hypothetical protein